MGAGKEPFSAHDARLYQRIFEAVPGGVVHVSADGAILLANETAQAFLGLSYDALSERYVADFTGETYRDDGTVCPVEDYPVSRCLATGTPQEPSVIGVRQPSGEVRWAVFTALPFLADDGRLGAVVSFVDITERKEAEAEVTRLQAELAIRDRLATIGTIAAAVTHEVNNPLAYILLCLEMAEECVSGDEPTEETLTYIRDATHGALRVRDIVREFTSFAKVDAATRSPVDLVAAMETAIKMATPETRYRTRVDCFAETEVPLVDGVEGRISQVFLNLLINASRAFPEKAPQNRVQVRIRGEGPGVVVEVSDNGKGMTEEQSARVFEPFFTTHDEGSGLGLPISRRLVEEMGGVLTFESTEGKGTTFRIEFPASAAVEAPVPAPAETRIAEPEDSDEPKRRLMVVDDEHFIGQAISSTLEDAWDISTATSVTQAIAHLTQDRDYAAVLCDAMLLDGTGVDLFDWLGDEAVELQSRFVLMTGGPFTDRVRHFVESGEVPLLPKPFGRVDLNKILRTISETDIGQV